jgi:isopentenyldiphosphate isomerase
VVKATIVDKNDRVIGAKLLEEIQQTDIYRVSSIWVTNSRGQVLLAQRQPGKRNDPGKWGPAAAGTVESGETYENNAYKEAMEEIGLSGIKLKHGPKILNDANKKFFVKWFTCVVDWPIEKFRIQKDEVEKLEWVDESTLVRELKEVPDKFIAGSEKVWKDFLPL